jgi:predicted ABC-type ATPase
VNETKAPELWLIAGPNGSGKTTFVERHLNKYEFVNADVIAKAMNPADPGAVAREAMFAAEDKRKELLQQGKTFVAETVFSHESKLDLVREAKQAGYNVQLVFICTEDPTLNAGRVMQRVAKGGHAVPMDKIAPRYARSIANAQAAVPLVDRMHVYDNTRSNMPHKFVALFENGRLQSATKYPPEWFKAAFGKELEQWQAAKSRKRER